MQLNEIYISERQIPGGKSCIHHICREKFFPPSVSFLKMSVFSIFLMQKRLVSLEGMQRLGLLALMYSVYRLCLKVWPTSRKMIRAEQVSVP